MKTPEATIQEFFRVFNEGYLEGILAFYEPQAAFVPQPGQVVHGQEALRAAIGEFLAMKPVLTLGKLQVVVADEIALSNAQWTLKGVGPDGSPVRLEGTTSDVLRRQPDGRWRFVIDNPWSA